MSQNLLVRVQIWTIILALVCSLALWGAVSFAFAAGVFLTALWAVAGFFCLGRLLQAAVLPPGTQRNGFLVIIWAVAKLAVYGLAVWVLFSRPFPPLSHAVGFTLLLVVIVVLGVGARSRELR